MLPLVRRACVRACALLLLMSCPTRGQAPDARPASPLQRLAQRLADDAVRLARPGPIEVAPIEDRTQSATTTWALDLRALVIRRLAERAARPGEAGGTRVSAILSQTGARLIVSARVEEAPEGRLIDLLSASAELDETWLAVAPAATPDTTQPVEVVSSSRTVPLDEDVLDLAWVDDERLLLLAPESLALYRWVGTSFTLEARRALPEGGPPVRTPGGLLRTTGDGTGVWALTSRAGRAQLFALDGRRLTPREQADALPLARVPTGLRYRFGTNLLEASFPGLGSGPWLAFEPTWPEAAVSADAELLLAGTEGARRTGLRVGAALAPLWDELTAAASAEPPARRDAILLLRVDAAGAREVSRLAVDGAVRALAAARSGDVARLVAGVQEPDGATHLEVFELRRSDLGTELP